jgi:hypothetical protein
MKRVGYIDGRRITGFTLAGALAKDGMYLAVEDISTPSSGTVHAVKINYDQNGAKAGATAEAFCVMMTAKQAAQYAYAEAIHILSSGNPALGFVSPLSIYVDDQGTACTNLVGLDMGFAVNNAPSGRHAFIRMRNDVGQIVKDAILIEGTAPITNLFDFQIDSAPVVDAAVATGQTKKLQIAIAGSPWYIPLYSS